MRINHFMPSTREWNNVLLKTQQKYRKLKRTKNNTIVPKTYAYTFTIMEEYVFMFVYIFFIFLKRRPSTVYGVYQTPSDLLGTSQVFTGN